MSRCAESHETLQSTESNNQIEIEPSFDDDARMIRLQLEEGLQEVRCWMNEVHLKLSNLQSSQSFQDAALQDVQTVLRSIFQASFQRKEAVPEENLVPLEDPPLLGFPGQLDEVVCDFPRDCIKKMSAESGNEGREKEMRRLRRHSGQKDTAKVGRGGKTPILSSRSSHACTLDELEAQTAKNLLVRKQSSHTLQSIPEVRESLSLSERDEDDEARVPKSRKKSSKRMGFTKTSGSDKNAILGKCNRMSLDELRENHDAAVCVNQSYSNKTTQDQESTQTTPKVTAPRPMPRVAELCLQLLCILPMKWRWAGHLWTLCVFLLLLAPTTLLVWLLVKDQVDTIMTSTVLCYLVGVIAAAWNLRRAGIQELLGSSEGSMEQQPVCICWLFFILAQHNLFVDIYIYIGDIVKIEN